MRIIEKSLIAILCVSFAACGGSSPGEPKTNNNPPNNTPPVTGNSVTVENNSFAPGALSVSPGQTVTWTWDACSGTDPYTGQPGTCVSHGVTFDDGTASGLQQQGTYTRTFATAGTYRYHCPVHGTAMSGTITVQ